MKLVKHLTQDWRANKGYSKGKIVTLMFRISQLATRGRFCKILLTPYLGFYKFTVEWLLGIELPYGLNIGSGFLIFHGPGLVINRNSIIGKNCILRHTTTIGNKGQIVTECPTIGDNVNIGAHCCILGKITIGDNVVIGAGSIVLKDIPSNAVVAGNPARIIRINEKFDE